MSTQNLLSYLSFVVGIVGVFVAFYQGFERSKLKRYVYSQAWHVFSITNLSYGATQAALNIYKEAHHDNINLPVFEGLAKCDAYNYSLFIETIRQIQLTEPKFNLETILSWAQQGKISKEQMPYFIRLMPQEFRGILSLTWQSISVKIKQNLLNKIRSPQQQKTNANQPDKPKS